MMFLYDTQVIRKDCGQSHLDFWIQALAIPASALLPYWLRGSRSWYPYTPLVPQTFVGQLSPKEATFSTLKELPALLVTWISPVLQPSLHNTAGHYLSAGNHELTATRRPTIVHLYLLIERWGPLQGKYCRKITSNLNVSVLKFPWKEDLFHVH